MLKLIIAIVFALSITLPALAQETPTAEEPTLEATRTADVVTATPSPTEEPTVTPTPEPVPVPPVEPVPPLNWNAVLPWLVIGGIALLIGFMYMFRSSLATAAAQVPLPVWDMLVTSIDRGIEQRGEYVKTTPNVSDDAQYEDLKREFEEFKLETARQRAEQQSQINQNTANIQNVSNG